MLNDRLSTHKSLSYIPETFRHSKANYASRQIHSSSHRQGCIATHVSSSNSGRCVSSSEGLTQYFACCLLLAITQHSKVFIDLTVNQFINTLLTAAAIWTVAFGAVSIVSNLRKSTGPRIFVKLAVPSPWGKIKIYSCSGNFSLFTENGVSLLRKKVAGSIPDSVIAIFQ